MPMMRSGSSAAIRSSSNPSLVLSTSGWASPSSSSAHGQVANGFSPYHSVTAMGTTPSWSRVSCSVRPTTTTRSGSSATTLSPNLCGTVTGKASLADSVGFGSDADVSSEEQDDASRALNSRGTTARIRRERMGQPFF